LVIHLDSALGKPPKAGAEVGNVIQLFPKERASSTYCFTLFGGDTMTANLLDGLQIVLVVSAASALLIPLLCWVLPNRASEVNNGSAA
jgi:hypothetical protein